MVNWTDSIIHWNQLPGTEVKRLLDTWGKDPAFIAKYDKQHGYVHTPLSAKTTTKSVTTTKSTTPTKAVKKAAKVAPEKAPVRQKHTGADGEIKFVEHRELYVGFFGSRVVVTKRTVQACQDYLTREYGITNFRQAQ
jgi:hypothetical protein